MIEAKVGEKSRGHLLSKIRLMIVDDSPHVIDSFRSIFRAHDDIDVLGDASNGQEAIAKAVELQPDLILMDAQMPGIDGVEATRLIKEKLPDTKILFLAVHPTHIDEALEAGADGFLMKDSGRQELLDEIRRLACPCCFD